MVPIGCVGGCSWTVALGRVGATPGRVGVTEGAVPGMEGFVPRAEGVAAGREAVPGGFMGEVPMGELVVASLMVGVGPAAGPDVLRGMVGAGDGAVGGPFFSAMVGAGAGGRGAPTVGVVGEMGGRTGAERGTVADGTEASAALSVTRTVSFLRGTLEVCLDGG